MLVAIALNHLDTELRVFSDYVFGFVSTAEGFVFLSGLVAGLVYTRRAARVSPAELRAHAVRRAGQIYGAHVASFLIGFVGLVVLALATNTMSPTSPAMFFSHPVEAVVMGVTLLYQPGLFDILPMYCGFMLAAAAHPSPALPRGARGCFSPSAAGCGCCRRPACGMSCSAGPRDTCP